MAITLTRRVFATGEGDGHGSCFLRLVMDESG
jgi:hypothetical protein